MKASDGSRENFEETVKYAMYEIREVFAVTGPADSLTAHRRWGDTVFIKHQTRKDPVEEMCISLPLPINRIASACSLMPAKLTLLMLCVIR